MSQSSDSEPDSIGNNSQKSKKHGIASAFNFWKEQDVKLQLQRDNPSKSSPRDIPQSPHYRTQSLEHSSSRGQLNVKVREENLGENDKSARFKDSNVSPTDSQLPISIPNSNEIHDLSESHSNVGTTEEGNHHKFENLSPDSIESSKQSGNSKGSHESILTDHIHSSENNSNNSHPNIENQHDFIEQTKQSTDFKGSGESLAASSDDDTNVDPILKVEYASNSNNSNSMEDESGILIETPSEANKHTLPSLEPHAMPSQHNESVQKLKQIDNLEQDQDTVVFAANLPTEAPISPRIESSATRQTPNQDPYIPVSTPISLFYSTGTSVSSSPSFDSEQTSSEAYNSTSPKFGQVNSAPGLIAAYVASSAKPKASKYWSSSSNSAILTFDKSIIPDSNIESMSSPNLSARLTIADHSHKDRPAYAPNLSQIHNKPSSDSNLFAYPRQPSKPSASTKINSTNIEASQSSTPSNPTAQQIFNSKTTTENTRENIPSPNPMLNAMMAKSSSQSHLSPLMGSSRASSGSKPLDILIANSTSKLRMIQAEEAKIKDSGQTVSSTKSQNAEGNQQKHGASTSPSFPRNTSEPDTSSPQSPSSSSSLLITEDSFTTLNSPTATRILHQTHNSSSGSINSSSSNNTILTNNSSSSQRLTPQGSMSSEHVGGSSLNGSIVAQPSGHQNNIAPTGVSNPNFSTNALHSMGGSVDTLVKRKRMESEDRKHHQSNISSHSTGTVSSFSELTSIDDGISTACEESTQSDIGSEAGSDVWTRSEYLIREFLPSSSEPSASHPPIKIPQYDQDSTHVASDKDKSENSKLYSERLEIPSVVVDSKSPQKSASSPLERVPSTVKIDIEYHTPSEDANIIAPTLIVDGMSPNDFSSPKGNNKKSKRLKNNDSKDSPSLASGSPAGSKRRNKGSLDHVNSNSSKSKKSSKSRSTADPHNGKTSDEATIEKSSSSTSSSLRAPSSTHRVAPTSSMSSSSANTGEISTDSAPNSSRSTAESESNHQPLYPKVFDDSILPIGDSRTDSSLVGGRPRAFSSDDTPIHSLIIADVLNPKSTRPKRPVAPMMNSSSETMLNIGQTQQQQNSGSTIDLSSASLSSTTNPRVRKVSAKSHVPTRSLDVTSLPNDPSSPSGGTKGKSQELTREASDSPGQQSRLKSFISGWFGKKRRLTPSSSIVSTTMDAPLSANESSSNSASARRMLLQKRKSSDVLTGNRSKGMMDDDDEKYADSIAKSGRKGSSKFISTPNSPGESDDETVETESNLPQRSAPRGLRDISFTHFASPKSNSNVPSVNIDSGAEDNSASPLRRRNSLDPSSARSAFSKASSKNSSEDLFVTYGVSPTPPATAKDKKKTTPKSKNDNELVVPSVTPPNALSGASTPKYRLFGVPLDQFEVSFDVTPVYCPPSRSAVDASSTTSNDSASVASKIQLPPMQPRLECPEWLTFACHSMVEKSSSLDANGLDDTLNSANMFSSKDRHTLRRSLDDGSMDVLQETDIVMIFHAIAMFLEELPDPVCPISKYPDFVSVLTVEEPRYQLHLLHSLIWSLSPVHRSSLRLIVDFILAVSGMGVCNPQFLNSKPRSDDQVDATDDEDKNEWTPPKPKFSTHTQMPPQISQEGMKLSILIDYLAPCIFRDRNYLYHSPRSSSPTRESFLKSTSSYVSRSRSTSITGGNDSASNITSSLASPTSSGVIGEECPKRAKSVFSSLNSNSGNVPANPNGDPLLDLAPDRSLNPNSSIHGNSGKDSQVDQKIPPLILPGRVSDSFNQTTKFYSAYVSTAGSSTSSTRTGRLSSASTASISSLPGSAMSLQVPYSPDSQLNSTPMSARSIRHAAQLLELILCYREYLFSLETADFLYENNNSNGNVQLEFATLDYCLELVGNSFGSSVNPEITDIFFLGASQAWPAEEVLAKIAKKVRSGDAAKAYVRKRGGLLLGALKTWVHSNSHLLASQSSFFNEMKSILSTSKDDDESYLLSDILAELTIAKDAVPASSNAFQSSSSNVHSMPSSSNPNLAGSQTNIVYNPSSHTGSSGNILSAPHSFRSTSPGPSMGSVKSDTNYGAYESQQTSEPGSETNKTGSSLNLSMSSMGSTGIPSNTGPSSPSTISSFSVYLYPIEIVAQQLCLIDFENLKQIKFKERIGDGLTAFLSSQSFQRASMWFNTLSNWASHEIILGPSSKERVARIGYFANLAMTLISMNDFNGALALYTGLSSISVSRLPKTYEKAKKKSARQIDALSDLFCMSKNYKNYNARLRVTAPPAVPQIVLFARNLSSLDENNPTFADDDRINVGKLRDYLRITSEIQKFQRAGYPYHRDISLSFHLERINPPDADTIYNLSSVVEPKK